MNNLPFVTNPNPQNMQPITNQPPYGGYNQQYLEQAMTNGTVSQERYEWARQMANAVMGTKY